MKHIVIERIFGAPAGLVWKSWTDPELIRKWWGPENFTAPSIKVDLRVGGKYIFCMHGPEGSQFNRDYYSAGEYLEIIPGKQIRVTDYFSDAYGNWIDPVKSGMSPDFPKKSDMTVLFEDLGDKTKLSINYYPQSEKEYAAMLKSGMESGWSTSLDKLAANLKS
jgi:uncharacterized protein YndB with AHSA1/START domain